MFDTDDEADGVAPAPAPALAADESAHAFALGVGVRAVVMLPNRASTSSTAFFQGSTGSGVAPEATVDVEEVGIGGKA